MLRARPGCIRTSSFGRTRRCFSSSFPRSVTTPSSCSIPRGTRPHGTPARSGSKAMRRRKSSATISPPSTARKTNRRKPERELEIAREKGSVEDDDDHGRRGARDVDRERVADRLADIERFEQGELVEVLADELGEPQEDFLARGRRLVAPTPVIEGPPGSGDGAVDVLGAPLGDPRDRRAVAAGDVVERPPVAAGSYRPSMNSSVRGVIAAARAIQSSVVGLGASVVMLRTSSVRSRRGRPRARASSGRAGRRPGRAGSARRA